ncbi:hypothetical protein DSO57_1027940 [Entomophthora muscae]|uniref:Uncharacterized protein n=1 Tax=Entomophthora muscae TaxID=34485 RepID=A0ACC2T2H3_9FUNG|nr:hypothetical protein DSO57_1027940 [Entomophthora muscae]
MVYKAAKIIQRQVQLSACLLCTHDSALNPATWLPNGIYHHRQDNIHPDVWRLVDSMVPNSGTWSLFRKSLSYIIKLAPILWWALPTGPAVPCPEPPSDSTYDWISDTPDDLCVGVVLPKVLGKNGQGVVGQSVDDCKVTPTFSPGSSNIPVLDQKCFQYLDKPLNSLEDLDHTVDERFVLEYHTQVPPTLPFLTCLSIEETLVELDYLLAWCCLFFKKYGIQS